MIQIFTIKEYGIMEGLAFWQQSRDVLFFLFQTPTNPKIDN